MTVATPSTGAAVSAKHGLYIGGRSVETRDYDEIRLPYDGSVIGLVARATDRDVEAAIDAALHAAPVMAALANHERAELLLRIAEQVRADNAELAQLICSETGKPIKEARIEAARGVSTLTAAAHEARQLCGEVSPWISLRAAKGVWR